MSTISTHVPSFVVTNFLREIADIDWVTDVLSSGPCCDSREWHDLSYTRPKPKNVYGHLEDANTRAGSTRDVSVAWKPFSRTASLSRADAGRLVRAVFRVENGKVLPPPPADTRWAEAGSRSARPTSNANDSLRLHTLRCSHSRWDRRTRTAQLHPHMILGHMASIIPLSNHNQSPRNAYQSAMAKQAMTLYASDYHKRLDKNAYLLASPQRPIVETQIMSILVLRYKMPSGCNAIVAIACYWGYNQEDSVIPQSRIPEARVHARILITRCTRTRSIATWPAGARRVSKPRHENTKAFKNTSYHAVQETGIPIKNAVVQENDVVIGKVVNLRSDPHGYLYRDLSTTHKNSEPARIDGIWQDKIDGYPFVKVRVIAERTPQIGDKFASRAGQKGTCGMILDECDMPFTASGLRPDIIMNPHAIPSRMTIAQLLETMYSRVGVQTGNLGDGTPYSHLGIEDLKVHMANLDASLR